METLGERSSWLMHAEPARTRSDRPGSSVNPNSQISQTLNSTPNKYQTPCFSSIAPPSFPRCPPPRSRSSNAPFTQPFHDHAELINKQNDEWDLTGFMMWFYTNHRHFHQTAVGLPVPGASGSKKFNNVDTARKQIKRPQLFSRENGIRYGCHSVFHLGGDRFRCV
jgi:hypothetical protein